MKTDLPITGNNIMKLLPQRPPILLIDTLLSDNESTTITSFDIPVDHIFCENNILREPGLIENIAQTGAAKVGYQSIINQVDPPIGFIGDIKKLIIHKLPKAGTKIETELVIRHEVFNVKMIKAWVRSGPECYAECEMKIFIVKENA